MSLRWNLACACQSHKMSARRPLRFSDRWRLADHNFAVATAALMIFFVIAGLGAWMLG
jgi:hypothetical protein